MHWKFRLWKDGQTNESAKVGEPYWDDVRNRVGVTTVGNLKRWFPRLLAKGLRLNVGDNLSGMTDDQTENTLVFDFNTPGEIRVLDTQNNNAVKARFTAGGTLFDNASVTGTFGFGGLINQILNGNLSVLRAFSKIAQVGNDIAVDSVLIAPNWQAWCSKSNGGNFTATIDSTDAPPGCLQSIKVVVKTPCYSGGVRTFMHSIYQLIGQQVCFSVWHKGPVGQTQNVRVRTDTGTIALKNVTGTGNWRRCSIPIDFAANPIPANTSFIAFDTLYSPTNGTADQPWRVGGAQINFGLAPLDLELRSQETEKSLLKGIYFAGRRYVSSSDHVSFDLLPGSTVVETDNAGLTSTEMDNLGVILNGPNPTLIKAIVMAYRLPTINE